MLNYNNLKNKPRELLAATGLKEDEFEDLLQAFAACYAEKYPATLTKTGQPRKRQQGAGRKGGLRAMADKLLFVLVNNKTYPIQTMLGLQFGISQSRVNEWLQTLSPILQQALVRLQVAPEREGEQVSRHPLTHEGGADLVLDGTERRQQRPQDVAAQREHYSGKKRRTRTKTSSW